MWSSAWEAKTKPAFVCVVLDLGGKESPLDLLNPLAASQAQRVRLPEPFLTPIPGCGSQQNSQGNQGEGQPAAGSKGPWVGSPSLSPPGGRLADRPHWDGAWTFCSPSF